MIKLVPASVYDWIMQGPKGSGSSWNEDIPEQVLVELEQMGIQRNAQPDTITVTRGSYYNDRAIALQGVSLSMVEWSSISILLSPTAPPVLVKEYTGMLY